jgi:hypothetical protein
VTVVILAIVLVLVAVVGANRWRYARRIASEVRLLAAAPPMTRLTSATELPPIVERYRQLALGDRAPVRTLHLRHGGTFRMSRTAKPKPIRGEQWFTADPPGFVWAGRVRLGPGMWVDARDMIVAGAGSMRVMIDDTITVANARGPLFDQGDALRLLAEMVWYPSALFDPRTVTWSAIDESHARATLNLDGKTVSASFELGPDGLPLAMTAERYNDKGELRPWGGVYRDWRIVDGMRVPFEAEVAWLETPPFVYAHWRVESIEYDAATPPRPSRAWATTAIVLELVLGIGAIGGGIALMLGPNGEVLPLPSAS